MVAGCDDEMMRWWRGRLEDEMMRSEYEWAEYERLEDERLDDELMSC